MTKVSLVLTFPLAQFTLCFMDITCIQKVHSDHTLIESIWHASSCSLVAMSQNGHQTWLRSITLLSIDNCSSEFASWSDSTVCSQGTMHFIDYCISTISRYNASDWSLKQDVLQLQCSSLVTAILSSPMPGSVVVRRRCHAGLVESASATPLPCRLRFQGYELLLDSQFPISVNWPSKQRESYIFNIY